MKKAETEMRAEYKRSDFTKLERSKFYKEVAKTSTRKPGHSKRTTRKRATV